MRVANPKAYLIFYDDFLKIAAGQACWKENMEDCAEGNLEAFATPAPLHYCAWRITDRIGCTRQRFYEGQSK
jgi:hypothetical protein